MKGRPSPVFDHLPRNGEGPSGWALLNMNRIIIFFTLLCLGISSHAQRTLSLDECINYAVLNNRKLQNAALDITSSAEQTKEMKTKYLPEVSANVLAFHAFDKLIKGDGTYPAEIAAFESIMPGISQLVGQPYSYAELNRGYSAQLSAMLPVYAGGQITTANRLAKVGSEVSELQRVLTEKDIVQKVTENYWHIVQVRYNLQTLDAAQQQVNEVYRQVSDFVELGVTTNSALLRVRLRQQELESNRVKLQHADQLLLMLLTQQIGNPYPTSTFDIEVPPLNDSTFTTPSIEDIDATYQRPELLLASKAVDAQQLQVRLERGKCLPTVALGVMGFHTGFGGLSDNTKNYINTTMTNGIGLATISVPISAWWGGKHAIRRAKIKLQQTKNDYQDAQEQLRIDTESSRLAVIEATEQIKIARTSVTESTENLRMANDQYRVGKTTITDLLDAETLHRQSQNNLSSAIADYEIKLADYKRKVK